MIQLYKYKLTVRKVINKDKQQVLGSHNSCTCTKLKTRPFAIVPTKNQGIEKIKTYYKKFA